MKRRTTMLLAAGCAVAIRAYAVAPQTSQTIILHEGWNAVYIEVAPETTADELFADWPVDHVGIYDPASFLATRQFGTQWDSEGLSSPPMSLWKRNVPEASSLDHVPAGSVCVTFCTKVTRSRYRAFPLRRARLGT